jgi:hypothetical protein
MFETLKFAALASTALALVPAGAHLLELLHKIHMPADRYLIVQSIYRGWALSAVVVLLALLSTLLLAVSLRGQPGFVAALIGFAAIAATQVVFWSATYPVNVATHNWTILPARWQELRVRWEYSHAASAVLNLTALFATISAVLRSS